MSSENIPNGSTDSAIAAAVAAEAFARTAAISNTLILQDFATDAAAATGGIVLYALYRTGNAVKIRME